jgi:hypothetical protein
MFPHTHRDVSLASFSRDRDDTLNRLPLCSLMNRNHQRYATKLLLTACLRRPITVSFSMHERFFPIRLIHTISSTPGRLPGMCMRLAGLPPTRARRLRPEGPGVRSARPVCGYPAAGVPGPAPSCPLLRTLNPDPSYCHTSRTQPQHQRTGWRSDNVMHTAHTGQ